MRLVDNEVSQDEGVHFALDEGAVGVGGSVDDGLAFEIERRVQYRGYASRLRKAFD